MARIFYKSALCDYENERCEFTCNGSMTLRQCIWNTEQAIAESMRKDPESYKAFGPYWWNVKNLMLLHGILEFGSFIDRKWLRRCDYGNEFDNIFAAWLYYGQSLEEGRMYAQDHTVYFMQYTNGAMTRYVSETYRLLDRDMEMYLSA